MFPFGKNIYRAITCHVHVSSSLGCSDHKRHFAVRMLICTEATHLQMILTLNMNLQSMHICL